MNAESIARQARKFEKQGQRGQAIEICESFLAKFPKNKRIQQQLSGLTGSQNARRTLPADQENRLKKSFNSGAYHSLLPQIDTLIDRYPESYFLWNLLGSTHLKLNDPQKAEAAFSKAVSIDAKQPNALVGLGDAFRCIQDHQRALESYLAVLKQHPDNLQALNNLGTLLSELGHYEQAADALIKAHTLAPENPMVLFNLSNVHRASGQLPQAADYLKRTLALMPQSDDARYNLALIQTQLGDLLEAVQNFEIILETTDPDHDSARAQKLHQMAHMCDWAAFAEFAQQPPDFGARGSRTSPFPFLALEDHPKRQLLRSKCYAARFVPSTPTKPFAKPASPAERIKIGYFSADFHDHATMYLMGRLFELHDRDRFDVSAYSFGPNTGDQERTRIQTNTDRFHDVGHLTSVQTADLARQHALDIAIDLKGYTGDSRPDIFTHRPAPMQISWLGYPGSMGCDAYDYAIADPVVLPRESREGFSENIIYMPASYQMNDDQREVSDRSFIRTEVGLPEQGFVFCSFNNSYKITPAEFDIWMRLLHHCEGSVLWLLAPNRWAQDNLRKEAARRGIDPARLVFAQRMEVADHLARHKLADLCLDTFACNAHTTASDALWVGVPIITKVGKQFAARVCASLLNAALLPELVANDAAEYEGLAQQFATQPDRLASLRKRLEDNRKHCPLFDTQGFARQIERAYITVHETYCKGRAPQDFHVSATPH